MNVLVTGGAGFIGSHVVDHLIDRNYHVTVLDNFSTGRRTLVHRKARIHRADIRSRMLGRLVSRLRPDIVVHAAAQASVSQSLAEPFEDATVNVLGTIRLLQACGQTATRTFVYISTGGAAYGDTAIVPTPEEHPLRPSSPYGVSKVSAERYVECFGLLQGIRTVTLRLANVYGPRQNPAGEAGVVSIFASRLMRGEQCVVNGDGGQTRDFVYVGDVADAIIRAVERPDAVGPINVGTGVETTINALYEKLTRIVGVRRTAKHGPARAGEQRRSALAPARAQQRIGWVPVTSLEGGLELTVEYFRRLNGG